MKKVLVFLFCALFCAAPELFALRPGDTADGSIGQLKWLNTLPVKLGKFSDDEAVTAPALRGVVFVLTRNRNSDFAVSALESCRRKHFRQLQIAVISPDPAEDVQNFAARHKETRLRFAVDTQRNVTPYFMAGNPLFPFGFLMDKAGRILWCGEAVDMPEAVERCFNGSINVNNEKKVAKLIDELHQRLRAGEMRALKRCADRILKLQPGHPTALRITLFALESSGNTPEAWNLLLREIDSSTQLIRLYFTALEMLRRHPELQKHLPEIAATFNTHVTTTAELLSFAGYLLQNFTENGEAFTIAYKQLMGKQRKLPVTDDDKAAAALLRAKLSHQIGRLNSAITYAKEAQKQFIQNENRRGAEYAGKLLKYYQTLADLSKIKY